jgi:hypothetical protein
LERLVAIFITKISYSSSIALNVYRENGQTNPIVQFENIFSNVQK